MKQSLPRLSQRYRAALRRHLKEGTARTLQSAHGLGSLALAAGLQTLDLAKLHEQTLVTEVLPRCAVRGQAALIRKAAVFFAAAITPIETTHHSSKEATLRLETFIEALSQRTVQLATSNHELGLEIAQRKTVEMALKKSELHYSALLEQSNRFQEQLRRLSRQILSAQEDERKKISRELHDVIAQTLTGINLQLSALGHEAAINTKSLERNIARTQRLVVKSVNIVHRFARELRPAVLDDLGLVPALHSFMQAYAARTGLHTRLTAFDGVERLDAARRTVLFRVAQEALTNVSRHAHASKVDVRIQRVPAGIRMRISDDGRSFQVQRVLQSRAGKRLGILGMRERLEMVGGKLGVESIPGQGTTILAEIPPGEPPRRNKSPAATRQGKATKHTQ